MAKSKYIEKFKAAYAGSASTVFPCKSRGDKENSIRTSARNWARINNLKAKTRHLSGVLHVSFSDNKSKG